MIFKIIFYIQPLWQAITANELSEFNGSVEATVTLLGAVGALLTGYINNANIENWDIWILSACSATEGFLLLCASQTKHIWISYISYIGFGFTYYFIITIAR